MKKDDITLTTLAARLERAIHADVGMKGLETLLYGWEKKDHVIKEYTFNNRIRQSGVAYLTKHEAKQFSQYCGYDLTHN